MEIDYPFTTSAKARRAFLTSQVPDWSRLRILEIGAFDNPTCVRGEADVRTLDWFTREQLVEKHRNNPKRRLEHAVDVDFVVTTPRLSEVVPCEFDLIIANHVIEHVPDVIGWLGELGRIVPPGGRLFMAVPDRRYTFDIDREPTDVVELVRCHDEKLERPSRYQILRALYYHRRVDVQEAWNGTAAGGAKDRKSRMGPLHARATKLSEQYHDVHCSVFTRTSFANVFRDLARDALVPFRVTALSPVAKNRAEFHCMLERVDRADPEAPGA